MQIHVVSSGETLFSIAQRYDVPAGILARYNGLAEPKREHFIDDIIPDGI